MNCPIDGSELKITDRQGIEIDYCPQCRGVWLDRGELDKIIERTVPQVTQPPPNSYRDEHYDKDQYKHHGGYDRSKRKRGSILGDLFDF